MADLAPPPAAIFASAGCTCPTSMDDAPAGDHVAWCRYGEPVVVTLAAWRQACAERDAAETRYSRLAAAIAALRAHAANATLDELDTLLTGLWLALDDGPEVGR